MTEGYDEQKEDEIVLLCKIFTNFVAVILKSDTLMDLTISMDAVLNFLHSMALSTSNKQWLADHLYAEVKAERAADITDNGWPKIRREDIHISPEVMKLVEDIEPLPDDFDYDKARLDHLLIKHG